MVEGKVRLRDDMVQLNCDSASTYQPKIAIDNEDTTKTESSDEPLAVEKVPDEPVKVPRQRLMVTITQTNDQEKDVSRLQRVVNTLKNYPGEDEVNLRVIINGRAVNLRMPDLTIEYCPDLRQQLVELVGEDGLQQG